MAQRVKNLPPRGRPRFDPVWVSPEKENDNPTQCSLENPKTEDPGGLWFTGAKESAQLSDYALHLRANR